MPEVSPKPTPPTPRQALNVVVSVYNALTNVNIVPTRPSVEASQNMQIAINILNELINQTENDASSRIEEQAKVEATAKDLRGDRKEISTKGK